LRTDLIDPTIAGHRGRIFKTTGDGILVEFASVVDAVRCASEWQRAMAEINSPVAAESRIEWRIGINVGDVIIDGEDVYGDGVNIAARLEALAEPGGICVSGRVKEDAEGKISVTYDDLGQPELKNIGRSVQVYRVRFDAPEAPLSGAALK